MVYFDEILLTCIHYNIVWSPVCKMATKVRRKMGPPGVLGIWGEWLFTFRELGSTAYYFRGAREQAHNFGDIGSLAKKQKK